MGSSFLSIRYLAARVETLKKDDKFVGLQAQVRLRLNVLGVAQFISSFTNPRFHNHDPRGRVLDPPVLASASLH